jgi:hypothetical protein
MRVPLERMLIVELHSFSTYSLVAPSVELYMGESLVVLIGLTTRSSHSIIGALEYVVR